MVFLVTYFVANCIISLFLERKKYKLTTIAHSVLFTFLLVCYLLSGAVPALQSVTERLIGPYYAQLLQQSVVLANGGWLAPMLVLEVVTVVLTLFACAITVAHIAEALSSGKQFTQKTTSTSRYQVVTTADEIVIAKKYMLKCSYLC